MKKILKKMPMYEMLRKQKRKLHMRKEFKNDYKFFKKNYMYARVTTESVRYEILFICHAIEKGMASNKPRRFGIEKTAKIMELVSDKCKVDEYTYNMALSCLESYVEFYKKHEWEDADECKKVKDFVSKKQYSSVPFGVLTLDKNNLCHTGKYGDIVHSRHSIREFSDKKIEESDILKALNIAKSTPSACNRQMCKIYNITTNSLKNKILMVGQGFSGFETKNANIFLVTFDVAANYFDGERNQGWFNAGLFSMNFVNALHSIGIGSCFVQFGNSFKQENDLKRELNIPQSERIAVIIAAGYYKDHFKVLQSHRKSPEMLLENR